MRKGEYTQYMLSLTILSLIRYRSVEFSHYIQRATQEIAGKVRYV